VPDISGSLLQNQFVFHLEQKRIRHLQHAQAISIVNKVLSHASLSHCGCVTTSCHSIEHVADGQVKFGCKYEFLVVQNPAIKELCTGGILHWV
jgi:hypothetical protein